MITDACHACHAAVMAWGADVSRRGEGCVIVVLTTMQSGDRGLFKQVNLGLGRGEINCCDPVL